MEVLPPLGWGPQVPVKDMLETGSSPLLGPSGNSLVKTACLAQWVWPFWGQPTPNNEVLC